MGAAWKEEREGDKRKQWGEYNEIACEHEENLLMKSTITYDYHTVIEDHIKRKRMP